MYWLVEVLAHLPSSFIVLSIATSTSTLFGHLFKLMGLVPIDLLNQESIDYACLFVTCIGFDLRFLATTFCLLGPTLVPGRNCPSL